MHLFTFVGFGWDLGKKSFDSELVPLILIKATHNIYTQNRGKKKNNQNKK